MSDSEYSDLIAELQVDYLKSFSGKFDKIKQLFENGQWHPLELEFHKLKGTGKTYGVPEVSDICREMERICRGGEAGIRKSLSPCIELLSEVCTAYQKKQKLAFELHQDSRYILLTEVSK